MAVWHHLLSVQEALPGRSEFPGLFYFLELGQSLPFICLPPFLSPVLLSFLPLLLSVFLPGRASSLTEDGATNSPHPSAHPGDPVHTHQKLLHTHKHTHTVLGRAHPAVEEVSPRTSRSCGLRTALRAKVRLGWGDRASYWCLLVAASLSEQGGLFCPSPTH